jgi:hypothetical protein
VTSSWDQLALAEEDPIVPILYENLLNPASVAVYKRVKGQTMKIAEIARGLVAEAVGGSIGDGSRSRKQFVNTRRGQFRVCNSWNSDNSTEVAAHARMGVRTVHLDSPGEVIGFFREHGLDGEQTYRWLLRRLRVEFQ